MKTDAKLQTAAVIAIKILRDRYGRRGIDLTTEAMKKKLEELEKQTDFDKSVIRAFFIRWIMPSVVLGAFSLSGGNNTIKEEPVNGVTLSTTAEVYLALLLLAEEQIEIVGLDEYCKKLANRISVELTDLHTVFLLFVLPLQLLRELNQGPETSAEILRCLQNGFAHLTTLKKGA
jgi:hypothetical protein